MKNRLNDYRDEIINVGVLFKEKASELHTPYSELSKQQLDTLLEYVATTFKSPDYILSYTSVWPLVINILSAFFCLGCSTIYHLMSV